MRFPPSFLEELRSRLPVSEVVGKRVKLKRAGREWKGLSPFNREKTPSFTVNDSKGFFHDFSSGEHGNIFDFVMKTEGVSFPEAVERLAAMAGVPVPAMSKEAERREERRKSLHEVVELAAKFFEETLAGRAGAGARGYLADRAVAPGMQLRFRLGYAPPERYALKEHLGAKGVPVPDMVEAGLLIGGDDIPVPYDRFRDRVMFPITDARGRVIAFGGRALAKDAQAKYLNSPETPLFHKGATLYNGAGARAAAHEGAPVIAVEGYLDVIACVGAGFPAAVAPLGTALTEAQLALLWKMSDEPILCFDGDAAGRRAAYRVVDLALGQLTVGKSLRFAALPAGQDPDDLVRAGGPEALGEVLASAAPLAATLWARETENGGFDTPERRAALETRLVAATETIADPTVRKYYRDDMGERVRRLFGGSGGYPRGGAGGPRRGPARAFSPRPGGAGDRGGSRGRGGSREPPQPTLQGGRYEFASPAAAASAIHRSARSAIPKREALILTAVLNHPFLLDGHTEDLAALEFRNPDADRLRRALLDLGHDLHITEPGPLREALAARELGPLLGRIEAAITHVSDWPARPQAGEEDVRSWWHHVISLHRKQRGLNRELREAERALGDEPSEENLRWIRDLQERLAALEGSEAVLDDFGASSGRPVGGV